ncbi:MAG: EutP/PduV family microcompartment system protein [Deltaproteobacteria bacterium]|jgi:ethanolamine utilization protein EutP (predicted NTPase)|nr:EutP/PduV family microcompartment system protein [Deltaproteobacteria bacterium]
MAAPEKPRQFLVPDKDANGCANGDPKGNPNVGPLGEPPGAPSRATQGADLGTAEKPLMVIGPVSAGKSTLLAALGLGPKEIKKTEALVYNRSLSIDTPGEMLAIPRFYNALILNSSRAYAVLMVMNGQQPIWLPSKIALALKSRVIGVVTKIDLAGPETVHKAELSLKNAGIEETFRVSPVTGQGLECLVERLGDLAWA